VAQELKVYHYPTCSTCRSAIKGLKAYGYELELHDIKATPPTAEELSEIIPLSGLPIAKWFNVSGEVYRELGLKDKLSAMSYEDKIMLLAANGMLIKRPIVISDAQVTIGYRAEDFERMWDKP
jgi:arsenate reductase